MKKFLISIVCFLPFVSLAGSGNFTYSSPSSTYKEIKKTHENTENIKNINHIKMNVKKKIKHQLKSGGAETSGSKTTVGGGVVVENGSEINGDVYIYVENHEDINVVAED